MVYIGIDVGGTGIKIGVNKKQRKQQREKKARKKASAKTPERLI